MWRGKVHLSQIRYIFKQHRRFRLRLGLNHCMTDVAESEGVTTAWDFSSLSCQHRKNATLSSIRSNWQLTVTCQCDDVQITASSPWNLVSQCCLGTGQSTFCCSKTDVEVGRLSASPPSSRLVRGTVVFCSGYTQISLHPPLLEDPAAGDVVPVVHRMRMYPHRDVRCFAVLGVHRLLSPFWW